MTTVNLTGTVRDVAGNTTPFSSSLTISDTGIQVPAPTGGNDRAMIQNIIDGAADGATINFTANATYLVGSAGIGVGTNKTQTGITLNGNNCLLFNDAATTADYRHCLKFGGTDPSGFKAVNCTANDFRVKSLNGGSTSWGHGILVRNASNGITIQRCTSIQGQGDGIYIGVPGGTTGNRGGPFNITVNDCVFGDVTTSNWARHCGSVTNAHDITFNRCTFDHTGGGSGGTTFDIEPLNDGDVGHHVTFDNCVFGWYSPNTGRRSVQCNGSGAGTVGAYVHTVTVKNSRSVGNFIGMLINSAQQTHPLFHDFVFTNNVSDNSYSVTLPMVKATAPVDVITVTNNTANLGTGGSFVSASGCTNVTQSGNVDTT